MTATSPLSATKEVKGEILARLNVEVPAEDFRDAVSKVYRKNRPQFSVPGFRRGKAPQQVLENYYGRDLFYEDAFESLFLDTLDQAAKATDTKVVGLAGKVEISEMDPQQGVRYSIDVYTAPEIKLPADYKGRHVEQLKTSVSDEEVEAQLEAIRQENGRWIPVDRPAKDGDAVTIDFTGKVDGVPFEGGSAEKQRVVLGSHQYIDGFEQQLEGIAAGDERTIAVAFPEDYPAADLAGAEATFDVVAYDVFEREEPELDDEFAQDISEYDTLDELRKSLRKEMEETRLADAKSAAMQRLLAGIVEDTKFEVPPPYIGTDIDSQLRELNASLAAQGMTMEQFLEKSGQQRENLMRILQLRAEVNVRTSLVAEALVNDMGLWTEENQQKYLEKVAELSSRPLEELRSRISEEDLLDRAFAVARTEMFDKLYGEADVELVDTLTEKVAEPEQETDTNDPQEDPEENAVSEETVSDHS